MASPSLNTDFFFVYDTKLNSEEASIKAHTNSNSFDTYYVTAHGISVEFSEDYIPDTLAGYLLISGMNLQQKGCITVSDQNFKSFSGIILPLREPAKTFSKCDVYNKISLYPNDQLKVSFLDSAGNDVAVVRLVVTLHFNINFKTILIN